LKKLLADSAWSKRLDRPKKTKTIKSGIQRAAPLKMELECGDLEAACLSTRRFIELPGVFAGPLC